MKASFGWLAALTVVALACTPRGSSNDKTQSDAASAEAKPEPEPKPAVAAPVDPPAAPPQPAPVDAPAEPEQLEPEGPVQLVQPTGDDSMLDADKCPYVAADGQTVACLFEDTEHLEASVRIVFFDVGKNAVSEQHRLYEGSRELLFHESGVNREAFERANERLRDGEFIEDALTLDADELSRLVSVGDKSVHLSLHGETREVPVPGFASEVVLDRKRASDCLRWVPGRGYHFEDQGVLVAVLHLEVEWTGQSWDKGSSCYVESAGDTEGFSEDTVSTEFFTALVAGSFKPGPLE